MAKRTISHSKIIAAPPKGSDKAQPVKQYPEYVGKTLDEVVKQLNKVVHVGTEKGSGFIFCGTPNRYEHDIDVIGKNYQTDFRGRKITEAYSKIFPHEGIILIVEGRAMGDYWDKQEYDEANGRGAGRPRKWIT